MKLYNKKRFNFIVKSFLWSVILYSALMVAFNWDEVHNSVTGRNNSTVISPDFPGSILTVTTNPTPSPSTSASHAGILKSIVVVFRTIIGISGNSR